MGSPLISPLYPWQPFQIPVFPYILTWGTGQVKGKSLAKSLMCDCCVWYQRKKYSEATYQEKSTNIYTNSCSFLRYCFVILLRLQIADVLVFSVRVANTASQPPSQSLHYARMYRAYIPVYVIYITTE